jgi:molecular chaperone HscA
VHEARAHQADDPVNTIVSVKRFMGRALADIAAPEQLPYRSSTSPAWSACDPRGA